MFYLKEIPFVIKKNREKRQKHNYLEEKSIIADFQYHILTLKMRIFLIS